MIKKILLFIRFLLAIFLLMFFIIKMYFIINTKLYENEYPYFFGYSYMKVDNNNLSPVINLNDYILLKNDKSINIDDYITYIENNKVVLNKVYNIEEDEIITSDDYSLNIKDVKAKLVFNNKNVSIILRILTHPVAVIFIFLYILFLPQLLYKRYE